MRHRPIRLHWLIILALFGNLAIPRGRSQQVSGVDRGRALDMLSNVSKDVQKHYYDSKFHGIDFDAKVKEEKQKINNETSFNMCLAHVAALDELNDSHTFFLPPPRPYRLLSGFQAAMVGNQCYILRVRPGSDAEAKGIKAGDQVLGINGYQPTRENLWKLEFLLKILRPQ